MPDEGFPPREGKTEAPIRLEIELEHHGKEFSDSKSVLRYFSDRDLIEEIRYRGYGKPDPK